MTEAQEQIAAECDRIREMLLTKNRKYGNSALEPVKVGGVEIPAEMGILMRIGDKWKRWNNMQPDEDEDVVQDLIGYLILLRVERRQRKENPHGPTEEVQPR